MLADVLPYMVGMNISAQFARRFRDLLCAAEAHVPPHKEPGEEQHAGRNAQTGPKSVGEIAADQPEMKRVPKEHDAKGHGDFRAAYVLQHCPYASRKRPRTPCPSLW